MIDEGDCGAIGGMKIGRGNRSTRRKPAPAPFCPPQIPLEGRGARAGFLAHPFYLVPTFADIECRVVSATDPHGR
jgi:hypothetical protein